MSAKSKVRALFDEEGFVRNKLDRGNVNGPTGIAGKLVEEMERRIILGYYEPGEYLSFNALAQAFGVSRQPISAAIAHLRASGYVEVLPQVGCRVVEPAPAEIQDFFAVLSKIDGGIAGLAAKRRTDGQLRELATITPPENIEELNDPIHRTAYLGYIDRFHELVWKMANAALLFERFGGMRNLASFYLWQGIPGLAPRAARRLIGERNKVADAIAKGDSARAARLMEKHIAGKPKVAGLILTD